MEVLIKMYLLAFGTFFVHTKTRVFVSMHTLNVVQGLNLKEGAKPLQA
jgi:hypothetical protein